MEIEKHIIVWHQQGLIFHTAGLLPDPRLRIIAADFIQYIDQSTQTLDLIAMDIDNGPEWLSHEANEGLYDSEHLTRIKKLLTPGGVATFWSADPSPGLKEKLEGIFGTTAVREIQDGNGAGKVIPAYVYIAQQ